jgi:hypothetical protein
MTITTRLLDGLVASTRSGRMQRVLETRSASFLDPHESIVKKASVAATRMFVGLGPGRFGPYGYCWLSLIWILCCNRRIQQFQLADPPQTHARAAEPVQHDNNERTLSDV